MVRRVPSCDAGRVMRAWVERKRRRFRQIVRAWILIHNEGVVQNRKSRNKKESSVGMGLQCRGSNSAVARAQMYYYQPDAIGGVFFVGRTMTNFFPTP